MVSIVNRRESHLLFDYRKRRDNLFVVLFRSTREFFTHGDITITGEILQILINTRHSWPLSSEGFLVFEDPLHSHRLLSVQQ